MARTTKYESLTESILTKLSKDFNIQKNALIDRANYSSKDTAFELFSVHWWNLGRGLEKDIDKKSFSILADEYFCKKRNGSRYELGRIMYP